MSELKFWEQDYVSTSTDQVDTTIQEAHVLLDKLKQLLEAKNKAYGNSALSDVNLFCNLSSFQLLEGQIEHKLRRLKTLGINGDAEDTLMDLMGYLTLYMVAVNRVKK